jgi:hypothetical protein
MLRKTRSVATSIAMCLVVVPSAYADDWRTWRGPHVNNLRSSISGHCPATKSPRSVGAPRRAIVDFGCWRVVSSE